MAKNKTTETTQSVTAFVKSVSDQSKREDCSSLVEIMRPRTGFEATMWGPSIIGFGSCHYKYESGREGDMPLAAFSPRKEAIVLYLSADFDKRDELLETLGKHKTGKGRIYIKKLQDVNISVLEKMVVLSTKHRKNLHRS
jgi:hypothetical protein